MQHSVHHVYSVYIVHDEFAQQHLHVNAFQLSANAKSEQI